MTLFRRTKGILALSLVALALAALGATSASASIVPAKFSSSSFKVTTTGVTLKRNGLEPKTCTLSLPIESSAEGSYFFGANYPSSPGGTKYSCGGVAILGQWFSGEAFYDNVAKTFSLTFDPYSFSTLSSPWGSYSQESFKASWVNGSGATASTINFNNTTIGFGTDGKALTLTGSLKVTTPAGGLVTLS